MLEYNSKLQTDERFIGGFLKACSRFRNAAGHSERFYNYIFRETLSLKNTVGISNNNKKLFSIYEGLKFFLPRKNYEDLTNELKKLITDLEASLNTNWNDPDTKRHNILSINVILKLMDFPENWHK